MVHCIINLQHRTSRPTVATVAIATAAAVTLLHETDPNLYTVGLLQGWCCELIIYIYIYKHINQIYTLSTHAGNTWGLSISLCTLKVDIGWMSLMQGTTHIAVVDSQLAER